MLDCSAIVLDYVVSDSSLFLFDTLYKLLLFFGIVMAFIVVL